MRWHCCQRPLGIVAVVALASLGHRCRRGAGVAWASLRCGFGVVVVLAPLPSSLGHCCRHDAGVIAVVATDIIAISLLALLRLSRWRRRGADVIAWVTWRLLASSSHRPGAVAIIAVVMLASSRTSRWRCCHRHVGIGAVAALTSLSRWHRRHRSLGIVTVAVLASSRLSRCTSSPSWRWHQF